ncbi:unannotated protein [freshwater metagenome]|uniref:Unannotated protein n=1 Tax=freshwater metagenome TaxID=449393 RepID=A0A6J7QLW3_9ZZZZ
MYDKKPFKYPAEASFIAALISLALTSLVSSTVKSVTEPVGTGTRRAYPSSFPLSSGRTKLIAFAAPVDVGIMFVAAPLARRKSLCGKSKIT